MSLVVAGAPFITLVSFLPSVGVFRALYWLLLQAGIQLKFSRLLTFFLEHVLPSQPSLKNDFSNSGLFISTLLSWRSFSGWKLLMGAVSFSFIPVFFTPDDLIGFSRRDLFTAFLFYFDFLASFPPLVFGFFPSLSRPTGLPLATPGHWSLMPS